jgi:hypothetical protein
MKRSIAVVVLSLAGICSADAEILAMLNYESKSPEALRVYQSPVPGQTRQEAIAVIDVDPKSPNF